MRWKPPSDDRAATEPTPLTERVLGRLRRPRWPWMVLWALVPLTSPLVFVRAIRFSGFRFELAEIVDLVATQAVLAYACLVLLWGTGVLSRRARELREDLAGLVESVPRPQLFGAIGSVRGPLGLTGAVAAAISIGGWATYGPLPPLVALAPLIVYLVPILTFVWVYLAILADLDRLGRRTLVLDGFPEDRTLGLEKVGSLASTGLGLLLVAAVPVLFAGSDEPITFGVSIAVVGLSVAVFVLSMWRLHRQMSDAKARYIALTRRLLADAYSPLREETTVDTLAPRASVLMAAQALDDRARSLPTWPLDEATVRFVVVVISSVLTTLIVRALFAAVGD